jgi:hypothetical protein
MKKIFGEIQHVFFIESHQMSKNNNSAEDNSVSLSTDSSPRTVFFGVILWRRHVAFLSQLFQYVLVAALFL